MGTPALPRRELIEELNQQFLLLLEYHAALGGAPMVIMGDLNLVEAQLAATVLARRSGWQDLSDEGTCVTSSSAAARRIDQVWVSPAFGGRTSPAEVLWSEGLPTPAVQTWNVLVQAADRIDHWQVGDAGPEEDEGASPTKSGRRALTTERKAGRTSWSIMAWTACGP